MGSRGASSHELGVSGERCKLSQWGLGQSPDCKCILDILTAQKKHLVAADV